jgi:hypothetical protein
VDNRTCVRCGRQFQSPAGLAGHHGNKWSTCYRLLTLAERFWPNVDRRGPDQCWPWKGRGGSGGYGRITRKGTLATHISLELAGRALLPGQLALHHCDNPPCVNPAHLYGGTPLDNMRDKVNRGRVRLSPEGRASSSAKMKAWWAAKTPEEKSLSMAPMRAASRQSKQGPA